jgi:hypothetical protein
MTITKQVDTDARRYTVATDTHLLYFVLAWGRVTDSVTVKAPRTRPTVSTTLPHATVSVFDDGFWCVAGVPERCFEDLTVANSFTVEISLDRYTGATVTVNVPPNPVWPVVTGSAALRPFPVRLQGRVMAKLTGLPVANGKVIAVDPTGPPPVPRPFLLRSPMKQDHTAAATIQGVTLTPVALAPPAKSLDQDSMLGSSVIVVNDRTGLGAGQIVRFLDESTGEYGRIASVSPLPAPLTLPGQVFLETAVQKGFPRTTALQIFNPTGSIGPLRNVQAAARTGDGVLKIDDYPSGDVLELIDGGLFHEFHAAGGLTSGDGYYAIDGIAGIERVSVGVDATGFPSPPVPNLFLVDYTQAVNVMDFRLK